MYSLTVRLFMNSVKNTLCFIDLFIVGEKFNLGMKAKYFSDNMTSISYMYSKFWYYFCWSENVKRLFF